MSEYPPCACGSPQDFAPGIGLYCERGFDCSEPAPWETPLCAMCNDTGVYEYTCGEGTCDMSRSCDCPAGVDYEHKLYEARREYLRKRIDQSGITWCRCRNCRFARGELKRP